MFNPTGDGEPQGLDLSKPSIRGLAHYLRHLPEGFAFNFARCETCAMGLAKVVWPDHVADHTLSDVTKAIGIPESYGSNLFISRGTFFNRDVSPEAIAEDLEKIALVFA